jgi:hypothetical protein
MSFSHEKYIYIPSIPIAPKVLNHFSIDLKSSVESHQNQRNQGMIHLRQTSLQLCTCEIRQVTGLQNATVGQAQDTCFHSLREKEQRGNRE